MVVETQKEPERSPRKTLVHFLSGGIAGTVSKTTIAPFERVKILFQIRSAEYPYQGFVNTIRNISLKEGIQGLWKGNSATVVRVFPYAAIQFSSFEFYKQVILPSSDPSIPPMVHHQLPKWLLTLCAGSLAGATSALFTYPLDLVRVRLAVGNERGVKRTILETISGVYKTEGGFAGLYRGIGPTLLGIFPYAGVSFASFEYLKKAAHYLLFSPGAIGDAPRSHHGEPGIKHTLPVWATLIAGAFSGAIGQTIAYPFDVIRRQMQTTQYSQGKAPNNLASVSHGYTHSSTWQGLKAIWAREGIYGLYRGLTINYIKVVPAVAMSFTTYEYTKKLLDGIL